MRKGSQPFASKKKVRLTSRDLVLLVVVWSSYGQTFDRQHPMADGEYPLATRSGGWRVRLRLLRDEIPHTNANPVLLTETKVKTADMRGSKDGFDRNSSWESQSAGSATTCDSMPEHPSICTSS